MTKSRNLDILHLGSTGICTEEEYEIRAAPNIDIDGGGRGGMGEAEGGASVPYVLKWLAPITTFNTLPHEKANLETD